MEGGVDTTRKALDEPRNMLSENESKGLLRT
jgi:hypothetical protein